MTLRLLICSPSQARNYNATTAVSRAISTCGHSGIKSACAILGHEGCKGRAQQAPSEQRCKGTSGCYPQHAFHATRGGGPKVPTAACILPRHYFVLALLVGVPALEGGVERVPHIEAAALHLDQGVKAQRPTAFATRQTPCQGVP